MRSEIPSPLGTVWTVLGSRVDTSDECMGEDRPDCLQEVKEEDQECQEDHVDEVGELEVEFGDRLDAPVVPVVHSHWVRLRGSGGTVGTVRLT